MIKKIISAIKANIRARIKAKPYDIYRERLCSKENANGYWVDEGGYIYFGHRWGVFIFAAQNAWTKEDWGQLRELYRDKRPS